MRCNALLILPLILNVNGEILDFIEGEIVCKKEAINTNIGSMPLQDYLEITAYQCGYGSYADMRADGVIIDLDPQNIISAES